MAVEVGDRAPDFELTDQNRKPVKLSDFRGKRSVVLVFHPMAFTGICEKELCTLRDDSDRYRDADVQVVAVSVDSSATHRAWADQLGIEYPYLADFWPHGEVARAYGIFDEKRGLALRATFFIDRDGIVTHKEVNDVPDGRDVASYVDRLEQSG